MRRMGFSPCRLLCGRREEIRITTYAKRYVATSQGWGVRLPSEISNFRSAGAGEPATRWVTPCGHGRTEDGRQKGAVGGFRRQAAGRMDSKLSTQNCRGQRPCLPHHPTPARPACPFGRMSATDPFRFSHVLKSRPLLWYYCQRGV